MEIGTFLKFYFFLLKRQKKLEVAMEEEGLADEEVM
jgi:hypothetical protein